MGDNLQLRFVNVMSEFIGRMFYGFETLKIRGIYIGDSIILLNYIAKHQPCTMTNITSFLGVIASTATRRVDKLVEKGLVERITSNEDRRTVTLKLAALGSEVHQAFFMNRMKGVTKFMQEFGNNELEVFLDVIEKYLKMVQNTPEMQFSDLDI